MNKIKSLFSSFALLLCTAMTLNAQTPFKNVIFDFGTTTSPVITDGVRVSETTSFSVASGYGWISPSGLNSRDRGTAVGDDGKRDFMLSGSANTFKVLMQPGVYSVTIIQGDHSYGHDNMSVFANDIRKADKVSVVTGQYLTTTFEVSAPASEILFRFIDEGGSDANWVLNTMNIAWLRDLDVTESKSTLKAVIDSVSVILGNTVVGNMAGQYPQNAFDGLTAAQNAANVVYTNSSDPNEVNTAIATLIDARGVFFMFPTLKTVIDSVSNVIVKAVVGNEYGQCSQQSYDDLVAARNAANAQYNSIFSSIDINNAISTLTEARTIFFSLVIKFVPDPSKQYYIIHSSNLFLTAGSDYKVYINTAGGSNNQLFRFIPVEGATDVYNIQVGSNLSYVTKSGSYNTVFAVDPSANTAKFNIVILDAVNNIMNFRCLDNSRNLGTDAVTAGSLVYSDKSGSDIKHKWTVLEAESDQLFPKGLEDAIIEANILKNAAVIGDEPGKYPQTAYDAFVNAIAVAQSVLVNATSQPELDNALQTLKVAIADFKAAFIVVRFTPEPGAKYRLFCADETLKDQYVQWTSDNTINWATLTDTEKQYFIFEKINIKPAEVDTFFIKMRFATEAEDRYLYGRSGGYTALRANIFTTATTQNGNNVNAVKWTISHKETVNLSGEAINYFAIQNVQHAASGKFVFYAADGTMQASNGSFGNGVGEPRYKIAMLKVDARLTLKKVIDTATEKLNAAVVGTEMGQYSQIAKDSLQKAIQIANTVYNNSSADELTIDNAQKALVVSLNWFISQQVSFSTAYVGRKLYVVHSGGNLLSQIKGDSVSLAQLKNVGVLDAWQEHEFVAVPGEVDVVSLKSGSGKFLAYVGGWNTYWSDSIAADTKLKITDAGEGYLNIKFVNKSYLGTDNIIDGTGVYSDKGATSINSKWAVQTPGTAIKIKLRSALATADNIIANTTVGTANFNFPQSTRTSLENAKVQSKSVFDSESATQQEVDMATTTLNTMLGNYYKSQIVPQFTPEGTLKYLITNKQNKGYVSHNETKAFADANVPVFGWEFVKVRDSVFVIKAGDKAIALSLNMVNYSGGVDQQWYVHYDGTMLYNNSIYASDTVYHFSFGKTGTTDAMQLSSAGVLQIASSHSHTDQSQWFKITKVGAPIVDVLNSLIAAVESTIANTVVGTAYGQYPQSARDLLNTALNDAKVAVLNTNLTQIEINKEWEKLNNALNYYNNQKVVFKPVSGMAYFLGNYANNLYMSVDTANVRDVKGYQKDSIRFDEQLWFFEPVEGKAGYYYIINHNQSLNATGVDVILSDYDKSSAKQWEIIYTKTINSVEYFNIRGEGSTYPYLYAGTNWAIDRYNSNNNYQIKIEAAGNLRTLIYQLHEFSAKVSIGSGIGQYSQEAFDTFKNAISTAVGVVMSVNATSAERETAYVDLKTAETTFRNSVIGYGLDLTDFNKSIEHAENFIESTKVIGAEKGMCPQSVIDELIAAISTARDGSGGFDQTILDAKVSVLNVAITKFVTDLKASTGLPALILESESLYENAVEGEGAGLYEAGSKELFKTSLDAAKIALDKVPVIQSDLIIAYQTLVVAYDLFNSKRTPDVDTRDLEDMIAMVQEYLEPYSQEEKTEIRALLAEAIVLLEKANKTQDEVNEMTERLYNAITGIRYPLNKFIQIFSSQNTIFVNGITDKCNIVVYNANGQKVIEEQVGTNSQFLVGNKGLYIVKVTGKMLNKRVVVLLR
jgi:hypothetical protein